MAYNIKRILKRETPDGWRVTGSLPQSVAKKDRGMFDDLF